MSTVFSTISTNSTIFALYFKSPYREGYKDIYNSFVKPGKKSRMVVKRVELVENPPVCFKQKSPKKFSGQPTIRTRLIAPFCSR